MSATVLTTQNISIKVLMAKIRADTVLIATTVSAILLIGKT